MLPAKAKTKNTSERAMNMLPVAVVLFVSLFMDFSSALMAGDRITASYRTKQGSVMLCASVARLPKPYTYIDGWLLKVQSRWVDLDLTQLPRFRTYGTSAVMPEFFGTFDPSDDATLYDSFKRRHIFGHWIFCSLDFSRLRIASWLCRGPFCTAPRTSAAWRNWWWLLFTMSLTCCKSNLNLYVSHVFYLCIMKA